MPEKDWLKVARESVTRPLEMPSGRKFLVYGRNKKGKTTFSLSGGVENTLVIDPERGTAPMKRLNPYVWPVNKWEDMNDAYHALRTGKLSPKTLGLGAETKPFSIVSVDGLTRINNMALKYVQKLEEAKNLDRIPGMVDRRYYNKSGELMKDMLLMFHNLPQTVIYTAQERMVTGDFGDEDQDEESTFFVADVPNAVRGAANSIVDVIGRLYVVKAEFRKKGTDETVEKNQRRMFIGVSPKYDTGYRSDFELPDVIKAPTVPKLINLLETGSEKVLVA